MTYIPSHKTHLLLKLQLHVRADNTILIQESMLAVLSNHNIEDMFNGVDDRTHFVEIIGFSEVEPTSIHFI